MHPMTTCQNLDFEAVLFDLDGVLVDTEDSYTEFWYSIDEIYPTGIENFAKVIKGTTLNSILNLYFKSDEIRDDIKRRLKAFERDMPFVLFPGALNLLKSLKNRGKRIAIVTSSPVEKMSRLMTEIPEMKACVDVLITDEDVIESKPSPEGYLLAASRLNVEPCRCVVVEDSINGLSAGRNANAIVVGLSTTNPRSSIVDLADYTFSNIAEAAKVLGC